MRGSRSAGAFLTAAEPFAWTMEDGSGTVSSAPETLNSRRVTQCALSRICAVCAEPLGRPIALLGTATEVDRNEFHAPPLHQGCAQALLDRTDVAGEEWTMTLTSGFEFIRPARDDVDRRSRFEPNSLL